jgi:metabotropic glutamate receptor 3
LDQHVSFDNTQEICNSELRLSEKVGYEQESKVQFVVDAVYAFAYALHNLHRDLCRPKDKVCPAMAAYDGGDFYRNYLLNVSFRGRQIIKVRTQTGSYAILLRK